MATFAAAHFFRKYYNISSRTDTHMDDIHGKGWDLYKEPGAFWVADMCLDSKVEVDENGVEHKLDRNAPGFDKAVRRIANQDVRVHLTSNSGLS